jgi:hypothetical protein
VALPRSRSYLGVAKETRPTPGSSPTAVAATDYIPYLTISPFDNITYLDDKGLRGSMTEQYNVIQGKIHSEIDITGDVFPDTIGYFYAGVLGDVTTTASVAPYTHTIALLNSQASNGQPPTFTLSDYYSLNTASTRRYAGTQIASIDTKFSGDSLMTFAAKGFGYQSVTAANPTASFSSVPPVPSWEGVVTLNASTTAIMAEGNVNITRPVTPIKTVDGTQRPYQLFAGPVQVEGAMMLILESDTELLYYVNNTQPSLTVDFTAGAGASLTQVQFAMTKCAFTVAKIDRGQDYIQLSVTYRAQANTTDVGASGGYSPVKVTLKNAKASGTYA